MNSQEMPHGEIDWIPLGKISVYPVTEPEIDSLERGSPESIFLSFAIFALSVGITSGLSLLLLTTASVYIFQIFLTATILGIIIGLLLLFLWKHHRGATKSIIKTIRSRKPPIGEQIGSHDLAPAVTRDQ